MADKKVKKSNLSLEQKVEIIQQLERGVMAKRIAQNFGVVESAISYIKKNKTKILASVADSVQDIKKKHCTSHSMKKWKINCTNGLNFNVQNSVHCHPT